uniref:Uncharacterized protein n=1 Tax=Trichobilharzia regenti TaxID=157069 RepID=A0AA85JNI4_TRIRE|nr:unnamed protein product [Trichobilharzia regenti]
MSAGYTPPSSSKWTGNSSSSFYTGEKISSTSPMPNCNALMNQESYLNASKSNNSQQNRSLSPYQQSHLNDTLKSPLLLYPPPPPSVSLQMQPIRNHRPPVVETHFTHERSSPLPNFQKVNPCLRKDQYRPAVNYPINRYNPVRLHRPPVKNLPQSQQYVNRLNISPDYHTGSYMNPRVSVNPTQRCTLHPKGRSPNLTPPKRTLSPEIAHTYILPNSPVNSLRSTPLPNKTNLLDNDNDDPDIWNIGSSTEFSQPVYSMNPSHQGHKFSLYNEGHRLMDAPKEYTDHQSIKCHQDSNVSSSECGSLISTDDDETVSLNTTDSEQNMNLLMNRHSISLQRINNSKSEMHGSTQTLVPMSKIQRNRFKNSHTSSCKSVHWNESQTESKRKSSLHKNRTIEDNLLLDIQPNKVLQSPNRIPHTFPPSVSDQPTTFSETVGDDHGDKWTVYYRNPNIPGVQLDLVNNDQLHCSICQCQTIRL